MNPTKLLVTSLFVALFSMILFPAFSVAQNQIPLTYEGSVTDERGYPLTQQKLTLKGTIFQDRIGGIIAYQETRITYSDAYGRFNEPFGQGQYLSGNAGSIDTKRFRYFFMVEIQTDASSEFALAYARPIIGDKEVINIVPPARTTYTEPAPTQPVPPTYPSTNTQPRNLNPQLWTSIADRGQSGTQRSGIQYSANGGEMNVQSVQDFRLSSPNVIQLQFKQNYGQSGYPYASSSISLIRRREYQDIPTMEFAFDDFQRNNVNFGFRANGRTPLLIRGDGNIGIGTTNPRAKLQVSQGDVYLDSSSKGVIMTSPNGQCWRLTITDRGEILTQAIQCP